MRFIVFAIPENVSPLDTESHVDVMHSDFENDVFKHCFEREDRCYIIRTEDNKIIFRARH